MPTKTELERFYKNSFVGYFRGRKTRTAHQPWCKLRDPSAVSISAAMETSNYYSACILCKPNPILVFDRKAFDNYVISREEELIASETLSDETIHSFHEEANGRTGSASGQDFLNTINEYNGWGQTRRRNERVTNTGAVAFILPQGNKFHRLDCRHLVGRRIDEIREALVDRLVGYGYEPCINCQADEL